MTTNPTRIPPSIPLVDGRAAEYVAECLDGRPVGLPSTPNPTEDEQDRVIAALRCFLEGT